MLTYHIFHYISSLTHITVYINVPSLTHPLNLALEHSFFLPRTSMSHRHHHWCGSGLFWRSWQAGWFQVIAEKNFRLRISTMRFLKVQINNVGPKLAPGIFVLYGNFHGAVYHLYIRNLPCPLWSYQLYPWTAGRHPDDEPIGQAFFSPEAIKAMSGAQLSVTDLGRGGFEDAVRHI